MCEHMKDSMKHLTLLASVTNTLMRENQDLRETMKAMQDEIKRLQTTQQATQQNMQEKMQTTQQDMQAMLQVTQQDVHEMLQATQQRCAMKKIRINDQNKMKDVTENLRLKR